jgi:cytochrome P450
LQLLRWIRKPVAFLESGRRRFGETFTARFSGVGPIVFTSDPGAIKAIFSTDSGNTIADGRNEFLEPVMGPRSVLTTAGEEHLRRRKLVMPALHGERIAAHRELIVERTVAELEGWPIGRPFELYERMRDLTLDVIMRVVLGIDDPARSDRLRALIERSFVQLDRATSPLAVVAGGRLGRFAPGRDLPSVVEEIDEVFAEEIAGRRRDPGLEERPDVLSLLVQARDEAGAGMDDGEIRDQLMTLLHAGRTPTAAGLAWAFDYLLRDRDAVARVRVADEDDPFPAAVVRETLRLRPIFICVGRELGSPVLVDGSELPARTNLMLPVYLTHTRPDLYPDPHEFRPERFMDGGPDTYNWIPFGGGLRRCMGAGLAELEMRLVLRTILARASLRVTRARPERMVVRHIHLTPRNGVPVVLEERR